MTTEQIEGQKQEPRRLDAIYWAGALIWVGLIFWADSAGLLPQIGQAGAWTWIFIGGGVAGLGLNFFSYSSPNYATPTTWDWIWSGLLLAFGLSGLFSFNISWPIILILLGAVFLANALLRHRQ